MMQLPTEITVLLWSIALLAAHMALQGGLALRERGAAWGAGPRDEQPPLGPAAARAARAFANFRETYPLFLALAVALVATGRAGGGAETGAWLWLAARVVYVPLYILGVPWVRSAAFFASVAGLLLMAARLA